MMDTFQRKPFIRWLKGLGYKSDGFALSDEQFSKGSIKLFIASDKPSINLYKKSGNFYHVVMHWSSTHEDMTDEEILFMRLVEKRSGTIVKFDELVKEIEGGNSCLIQ
jgi:hypothetical protein